MILDETAAMEVPRVCVCECLNSKINNYCRGTSCLRAGAAVGNRNTAPTPVVREPFCRPDPKSGRKGRRGGNGKKIQLRD